MGRGVAAHPALCRSHDARKSRNFNLRVGCSESKKSMLNSYRVKDRIYILTEIPLV